jgi:hypothetical protein
MADQASKNLAPHTDLAGREHDVWVRRAALTLLTLFVVLALLNAFGQHPAISRAAGTAASLEVQSPSNVRGGLIFQARFTLIAHRRLAKPSLLLQRGWFESMSVNSIIPQPENQSSREDSVRLDFPPIAAGRSFVVWIYFQVNPTNVGSRSENVELLNDGRSLVAIHRDVTVWP